MRLQLILECIECSAIKRNISVIICRNCSCQIFFCLLVITMHFSKWASEQLPSVIVHHHHHLQESINASTSNSKTRSGAPSITYPLMNIPRWGCLGVRNHCRYKSDSTIRCNQRLACRMCGMSLNSGTIPCYGACPSIQCLCRWN